MAKYVLAFRGQPDRTPAAGEDEAWGAWFGSLGAAVIDAGHRVGQVRTLPAAGAGDPAAMVLTGYVVITAGDLQAATDLARGCPGLRAGVSVEVGEDAEG